MNFVTSILGGPFTSTIEAIASIVGKFVGDPAQKVQMQTELMRAEQEFRVKMLEADSAMAAQQASVIMSEAKSESWLARNWRPLLMVTFTYIVAHTYVFAPLFGLRSVVIPPDMWELLRFGMGGYIIGRSAEKIAPSIADAIKAKKDA